MAFPFDILSTALEVWYSDAWHTITPSLYSRNAVRITRGRQNEAARVDFGHADFLLNNRDGTYSPRNVRSPLYHLIGPNTPMRFAVDGYDFLADHFDRTAIDEWNIGRCGIAWTLGGVGFTAAEFDVRDLAATMRVPTNDDYRKAMLMEANLLNPNCTVRFVCPEADVTGAPLDSAIMLRIQDDGTHYVCRAVINADESVTASIQIRDATDVIGSLVTSATVSGLTNSGQAMFIRAEATGSTIRMRVWQEIDDEPVTWDASATDTTITTAGGVGLRSHIAAGNTNAKPLDFVYGDFSMNRSFRISGEVVGWPSKWLPGGQDVWVPIQITGLMQRLNSGGDVAPLDSALFRAVMRTIPADATAEPIAYWPLEDAGGRAANAVAGEPPLALQTGTINWASSVTPPGGSAPVADLSGGGILTAAVHNGVNGQFRAEWIARFNVFDVGGLASSIQFHTTGGTHSLFQIDAVEQSNGGIYLRTGTNAESPTLVNHNSNFRVDDETWRHYRLTIDDNAGNVDYELFADGVSILSGSLTTATSGTIVGVTLNPTGVADVALPALGHLGVWNTIDNVGRTAEAAFGYLGETAGRRIERLCDEEGITFAYIGDLDATEPCGPQAIAVLVTVMDDAQQADQGILGEMRGALGLQYRTRESMYSQGPRMRLLYDGTGELMELDQNDDAAFFANDVTAYRSGGSSARSVLETGRMSILPPTEGGIGPYRKGPTFNVNTDDQLIDLASWLRHLGTWDEERYQSLQVQLHSMAAAGKENLVADAGSIVEGDLVTITNTPDFLPMHDIRQLVQGYDEEISQHLWYMRFNTTPAGPWTLGGLEDEDFRLDSADSFLQHAITDVATSARIAVIGNLRRNATLWSTTAVPYTWNIDGEDVDVTAMTQDVAAFVAAGTAGVGTVLISAVSATPGLPAGTQLGDLLLVFAANSDNSTSTIDVPSGYTALKLSGANVGLYGKIHTGTESAPTVFGTGSIGASLLVQMAAFRNTQIQVLASADQSNASAADIATPALVVPRGRAVVLTLGWKQDDWTSVATLAGNTEIGEPDNTTGDDQGIVWDFVVQPAKKVDVAATSFVVTGGTNAISRGLVVVLAGDVQTATLTRSVNDVEKAHVIGTQVSLRDPLRLGW